MNCQSKESFSNATKLRFSPYLVIKIELEPKITLTDDNISKLKAMELKVIDIENEELMLLFQMVMDLRNLVKLWKTIR